MSPGITATPLTSVRRLILRSKALIFGLLLLLLCVFVCLLTIDCAERLGPSLREVWGYVVTAEDYVFRWFLSILVRHPM